MFTEKKMASLFSHYLTRVESGLLPDMMAALLGPQLGWDTKAWAAMAPLEARLSSTGVCISGAEPGGSGFRSGRRYEPRLGRSSSATEKIKHKSNLTS